jgi:hypothetical protein
MTQKIFFLDDDAERHKKFKMDRIGMDITAAWNYADACAALAKTKFDLAYLDHDLSELAAAGRPASDEKTGTHVAEFIAALPDDKKPKFVILHSFNDAGRRRMAAILDEAGVQCMIAPFGSARFG